MHFLVIWQHSSDEFYERFCSGIVRWSDDYVHQYLNVRMEPREFVPGFALKDNSWQIIRNPVGLSEDQDYGPVP